MKKISNDDLLKICNSNIKVYNNRLELIQTRYDNEEISIEEYLHQKLIFTTKLETYKEIKELLE